MIYAQARTDVAGPSAPGNKPGTINWSYEYDIYQHTIGGGHDPYFLSVGRHTGSYDTGMFYNTCKYCGPPGLTSHLGRVEK